MGYFFLFKLNKLVSENIYKFNHFMEHRIRSVMASHHSKENPIGYLSREFYEKDEGFLSNLSYYGDGSEFNKLLEYLNEIHDGNIKKYNDRDLLEGHIPFWRFIDQLSLGTLAMILKYSPKAREIYKELNMDWRDILTLKKYRNESFHVNKILPKYGKNINISRLIRLIKRNWGSTLFKEDFENLINNYFIEHPSIYFLKPILKKKYKL